MDGLVHKGMGSDLMALCGKVGGTSGIDQVKLSYVNDQVTCPVCLEIVGILRRCEDGKPPVTYGTFTVDGN